MPKSNEEQKLEYFRRCFKAVDGLWFCHVEEEFGLDEAFDLDGRVWEAMGKIQVRTTRNLLEQTENTPQSLARCLEFKMEAEGYQGQVSIDNTERVELTIKGCPWLDVLNQSNRTQLANSVAEKICTAEYGSWAREFGRSLKFDPKQTLCSGAGCCRVCFQNE